MSSFAAQAKEKGLQVVEKKGEAFASSESWFEDDKVVSIAPKWKVKDGEGVLENFEALLPKFCEVVKEKERSYCMHYSFVGPSDDGYVICREGYTSGDGVLKHLEIVGDLLKEADKYANLVEVAIQGPAGELEKLKKPLAHLSPQYFPTVPGGFRNKFV